MRTVAETALEDDGVILPNDFHGRISLTKYLTQFPLDIPADIIERLKIETRDFVVAESVLYEVAAALMTGHLVIQGPPGTGKSSLVSAICRAFYAGSTRVTGREDLSTYDIIGRQDLIFDAKLGRELVVPTDGSFTEAVIECAGAVSRHQDLPSENPRRTHWLLFDELNRANVDRAFGELFTVLGTGDDVGVPLAYYGSEEQVLSIPGAFRIIATMNSIDKQFVNSMSLAIRRRFTFITLDIPPKKPSEELWDKGDSLAAREFQIAVDSACGSIRKKTSAGISLEEILEQHITRLSDLFSVLERVRYSTDSDPYPYLPIGTASLIDTVELFLSRLQLDPIPCPDDALDWAASVKLGPLFEVDHLDLDEVSAFASQLEVSGLYPRFAAELKRHTAAGQSYVQ